MTSATPTEHQWWQRGIVYQVYPRSFIDSNGDGVGDLPGITSRLDHVHWLGVDALWISPIFPSPMADFGYDVSNYVDVDPRFGTLADLDRLLTEAHARGLRVLLDFVPNHTSDRHPWFLESRVARTSVRRDWYIWRDPAPGGGPPNNWLSVFGGSAWQLDAATGQYYYHAFLKEQPDLNWRNPAVQAAMLDVLRFWLDRGVDGFRIDALRQIIKDQALRDNPPNPAWLPGQDPYLSQEHLHTADLPEIMDVVAQWRELADGYPGRVLIGELYLPLPRLVTYYGAGGRGLHLPFNFHLILTAWQARSVGALIETYESLLPEGAWPNWVLGNHDQPRLASRVGQAQARVAAMLLLTLRGTPTIYNGEEIGMRDVPIPADQVQDPVARRLPGLSLGRDPERTPLQWDDGPNAGFTSGAPWLPIADDYQTINVRSESDDPGSMLSLYRRLIELRRATPALAVGSYRQVYLDDAVLVYARELDGQEIIVALNFSSQPRRVPLTTAGPVALSTHPDRPNAATGSAPLELRSDEGVIIVT